MATSSPRIRPPAVAGRFYPDNPRDCLAELRQYTQPKPRDAASSTLPGDEHPHYTAGIVPHAGWVCSGRVAGRVWRTLADQYDPSQPLTLFLTGSVHTITLDAPALDTFDAWATPLGPVTVDRELRDAIAQLPDFQTIDAAHIHEHALEVQLPFIRHCFGPDVRIVPCMIPPDPRAADWGRSLAQLLRHWPHAVLLIASSDLTHYGPNYRFTPAGTGPAGRHWAHHVNDQRLLDLITSMQPDAVVDETESHQNACGGGAIAAVLAAAQSLGSTTPVILEHTDSATVLAPLGYADDDNSVGYAAIVM